MSAALQILGDQLARPHCRDQGVESDPELHGGRPATWQLQHRLRDAVQLYEKGTPQSSPRGLLLINKLGSDATFLIKGASGGLASCVDGTGAGEDGPGFAPPIVKRVSSSGELRLGPYGVAVVTQLQGARHSEL